MTKEIRQISIFLENRMGRLAQVTSLLGASGIDILAISVADTADFGILRMLVNDVDKAVSVLRDSGTVCTVNPVSVVPVEGVPGGLAKVLSIIQDNALNIEYMYAVSQKPVAHPLMVFRFINPETARLAFSQAGVETLTPEEFLA